MPVMLEALCSSARTAGLYLDDMVVFLWDEFQRLAMTSSIRKILASRGWSKKTTQQRAKKQNAELGEFHLHNLQNSSHKPGLR